MSFERSSDIEAKPRTPYAMAALPCAWEIAHDPAIGRDMLRFGEDAIAVQNISGCRTTKARNWDVDGQYVNCVFYLALSIAFLLLVVEGGWRLEYLVAVALFGGIAAMAMGDVATTRGVTYYTVTLALSDNSIKHYATPSADDAEALVSRIREINDQTRH